MKHVYLQLVTSFTATGLITFTVTHMHMPILSLYWWLIHWLVAWPIAFITMRWIAPVYQRILQSWTS